MLGAPQGIVRRRSRNGRGLPASAASKPNLSHDFFPLPPSNKFFSKPREAALLGGRNHDGVTVGLAGGWLLDCGEIRSTCNCPRPPPPPVARELALIRSCLSFFQTVFCLHSKKRATLCKTDLPPKRQKLFLSLARDEDWSCRLPPSPFRHCVTANDTEEGTAAELPIFH